MNDAGRTMKAKAPGMIYSPQIRVEWIIATGRMVLAAFFLLALWIDPSEPVRYAKAAYPLLAAYLIYSIVLFLIIWRTYFVRRRTCIVSHVIDLLAFAGLLFFTEGLTSHFFVFFVFLLVCATLRWQWQGALWTGGAVMLTVVVLAFLQSFLFHEPAFELNRFISHIAYLAIMALLLGYVGALDDKMHRDLSQIAVWPRFSVFDLDSLIREMLAHIAGLLKAPRVILTWEEKEEPGRCLAAWSENGFQRRRETPTEASIPLVDESLRGASFLCRDTSAPQPFSVAAAPTGFRIVTGAPLGKQFQKNFSIKSVLCIPLRSRMLQGYLFVLNKASPNLDDLLLGEIMAQRTTNRMERFLLREQIRRADAAEERLRLARDLHDGILQSLTAAALQIEAVRQGTLDTDWQAARARLLEIQNFIASLQRELRGQIQELRLPLPATADHAARLTERLEELAERGEQDWGLAVEMNVGKLRQPDSSRLAQDIYFIIQEALTNAGRHAAASAVRIDVVSDENEVHIAVEDNGQGFPFEGRYDDVSLTQLGLGPVTLRERVASLGGKLTLETSAAGTKLEIAVPRDFFFLTDLSNDCTLQFRTRSVPGGCWDANPFADRR